MHFALIVKIIGMLLMVFSITLLPPVLVAWIYEDGLQLPFLTAFLITLLLGMALWLMFFRVREELGVRDGFLVVTLFWTVLGVIGSLPFLLILKISVTDAVFESMSGLTTTGASVLSGLDHMAPSLLYYRQQLQWLGGMGVVVLAVAILPMLGVGGMQLYKAEIPGPMKESKLTPRIAETAKALWYVYLTVTVACATGYWLAGMSVFDAICHSFSTVSTGGFSTRDASMAAYGSAALAGNFAIISIHSPLLYATGIMAMELARSHGQGLPAHRLARQVLRAIFTPALRAAGAPELRRIWNAVQYIAAAGCAWSRHAEGLPAGIDGALLFLPLARRWPACRD